MMKDYIVLMYDDSIDPAISGDPKAWEDYLGKLRASGCFGGGSAIGEGQTYRKRVLAKASSGLTGFIRICCENLQAARAMLEGNPEFEAGATVEIRELPKTD
jgi:hypothetical protein